MPLRPRPLWNPPAILRGNVKKRYLLELEARGIPVVPTTLVEQGGFLDPAHAVFRGRVVVKPEVGAGSGNTRAFDRGDASALVHLAELTATGAALVQPYLASVDDYGERSLVFIAGELTHAMRKAPRFAGGVENVTGPFPIADDERALAELALEPYAAQLLYGRVDIARGADGAPMIMELELVEPSLFFKQYPPALARFVAALETACS